MYNTIPEIDTRTQMFRFIYFKDLLFLVILALFLWFSKNNLIWFLRIPYFFIGMFFAIYIIRDSCDNIGKRKIHSIYYFLKRNRKTVKSVIESDFVDMDKREKRKKIRKLSKNIFDYQYFISIDKNGILHHKMGQFVKIFKIETIDILNLNEYEKNGMIYDNIYFYRKYLEDFKIVSMRFPCDFNKQIIFLKEKFSLEKNNFRRKFLELKIKELEILEDKTYNLEFYLYIFSNDYDNLIIQIESIKKDFPIKLLELDKEKIERVVCRLNNMNTKI